MHKSPRNVASHCRPGVTYTGYTPALHHNTEVSILTHHTVPSQQTPQFAIATPDIFVTELQKSSHSLAAWSGSHLRVKLVQVLHRRQVSRQKACWQVTPAWCTYNGVEIQLQEPHHTSGYEQVRLPALVKSPCNVTEYNWESAKITKVFNVRQTTQKTHAESTCRDNEHFSLAGRDTLRAFKPPDRP
jgi:hypothetical protein